MTTSNHRDPIVQFYADLIRRNGLRRCDHLFDWFNRKTADLAEMPEVPDRSGRSRTDRVQPPRAKLTLALHSFVFPDLPLKKFSDLFGLNYGSVRNWRITDEVFPELVQGYAGEYILEFTRTFMRCAESAAEADFAKSIRMAREAGRYPHEQLAALPRALHEAIKSRLAEMIQSDNVLEDARQLAQYKVLDRLLVASGEGAGAGLPAFLRAMMGEDLETLRKNSEALEAHVDDHGRALLQQMAAQTAAGFVFWGVLARELIG